MEGGLKAKRRLRCITAIGTQVDLLADSWDSGVEATGTARFKKEVAKCSMGLHRTLEAPWHYRKKLQASLEKFEVGRVRAEG